MKELKILAVVVAFTLITYYLVEPYAHSQMHKHTEFNNFVYDGKADIEEVEAKIAKIKKDKEKAESILKNSKDKDEISVAKVTINQSEKDLKKFEDLLKRKKEFWAEVEKIDKLKGDATNGEALFSMCQGCHFEGATNMGGVTPPSLEHAGSLYDKRYLIALIKNPAMASNIDHKFKDPSMHPMGSVMSMVTDDQSIADIVAYLKTKKAGKITPEIAYVEACGRCHADRYMKWTQVGFVPKTKENIKTSQDIEGLKFKQKVAQEQALLADYLGKLPPDLSIIIRARSEHFLKTFVENPQSQLPGTAMPRVGLRSEAYEKVLEFLADSGDAKRDERASLGYKVLIYLVILAVFAYLWKREVWRELH